MAIALHISLPQSCRLSPGECWDLMLCQMWLRLTFCLPAGNYAFAKDYDQVVRDTWSIINNQASGDCVSHC